MNLNPDLDVFDPKKNHIWEIGQRGGRTRPIDKEILMKNLEDVHSVFVKLGIKHWLSHGTLLGAYRDNDFITWDDDADISADMKDRKKGIQAEEELRKMGFYVPPTGDPTKPVNPKSNMPYSDTVAIRDGEKVEVWWWTKQGDKYIYDPFRPPPELVHEAKFYDTLDFISFQNRLFPCPSHIEEWIVKMYGNSWNVPKEGVKYSNEHGRKNV